MLSSFNPAFNRTYISQPEEIVIDDLQPFSLYTVTVAATNSIGVGPFTQPEPVQTLEDGMFH